MVGHAARALWVEPRPPHPPGRVWRDGALVALAVSWSFVEAVLREDLAWRPVALAVSVVIALTLPWRRTHPFAVVAIAFGTLIAFDIARILGLDAVGLASVGVVVFLPYSLFR